MRDKGANTTVTESIRLLGAARALQFAYARRKVLVGGGGLAWFRKRSSRGVRVQADL